MKVQPVWRALITTSVTRTLHAFILNFLHWEYWMSRTRDTRGGESVGSRVPTDSERKETIVVLLITIFTCVVPFCLLCDLTRPHNATHFLRHNHASAEALPFQKTHQIRKMTISSTRLLSEITRWLPSFAVVSRRFAQTIWVERPFNESKLFPIALNALSVLEIVRILDQRMHAKCDGNFT